MIAENGLSKITVKKSDLLTALKKNRTQHAKDFADGKVAHRKIVIAAMKKNLAKALRGGRLEMFISLPAPENHTKEYDRVIRMLEMATSNEIVITEHEFTQYVLDEWHWKANFVGSTQAYMASAGKVRG